MTFSIYFRFIVDFFASSFLSLEKGARFVNRVVDAVVVRLFSFQRCCDCFVKLKPIQLLLRSFFNFRLLRKAACSKLVLFDNFDF